MTDNPLTIRSVAKRAVREQIAAAAIVRFRKNGFQATTVEEIASDVGMSIRTFFRYFPSKDDVLLGSIEEFRDRFLERLDENVRSTDLWTALEAALIAALAECSTPEAAAREAEVQAVIRSTPALVARQLEIMERLKVDVADRFDGPDRQDGLLGWTAAHAITGSAFACLQAAQARLAPGGDVGRTVEELKELMRALRPSVLR